MQLFIKYPDGSNHIEKVEHAICVAQLLKDKQFLYPILACKINHTYQRLNTEIEEDSLVELFDLRNSYANMS